MSTTNSTAANEPVADETATEGLNWADDPPRGGKVVMNRVLKDGAKVPLFFGQTLINSLRDVGLRVGALRATFGFMSSSPAISTTVMASCSSSPSFAASSSFERFHCFNVGTPAVVARLLYSSTSCLMVVMKGSPCSHAIGLRTRSQEKPQKSLVYPTRAHRARTMRDAMRVSKFL